MINHCKICKKKQQKTNNTACHEIAQTWSIIRNSSNGNALFFSYWILYKNVVYISRCRMILRVFTCIAMTIWHAFECYICHDLRFLSYITYIFPWMTCQYSREKEWFCWQYLDNYVHLRGVILYTIMLTYHQLSFLWTKRVHFSLLFYILCVWCPLR
jgi:hypothetical protein